MPARMTRSAAAMVAALASASLVLTSCGSSNNSDNGGGGGGSASGTWPGANIADCAPLSDQLSSYGDLTGKTVEVYTSITAPEGDAQQRSYKLFEQCTGAKVQYDADKDFETQVLVKAQANNLGDIAFVDQPGLLASLVNLGVVQAPPQAVSDNVDKWWTPDWKNYGTVDGTFYAAPLGANVKSFVWYSPKMFQEHHWQIPKTWDQMMSLTAEIQKAGIVPWCAGFESGEASGWPGTDWLEETVLRQDGPDVYDQWVQHKIPFNDPKIAQALDTVGAILKNDQYVNGGLGDVKSIATTAFQDAGLPILQGKCAMHQMASFYASFWPKGTNVSQHGDVFAFYLPVMSTQFGQPVEGGGEFVAAFNSNPVTQAFQTYLSTDTWANAKAKATPDGGWVSANKGLQVANLTSPIDKLSAQILQNPHAVFRFDASDAMPAVVGTGTFFKEMVNWINGQSTQDTLSNIEQSWPAS